MNVYIGNVFSLQMLDQNETLAVEVYPLSTWYVQSLLKGKFTSIVGHAPTATIMSNMFNTDITYNKTQIQLSEGDFLVVAQISGGRIPDGAHELPEGLEMKFSGVKLLRRRPEGPYNRVYF